MQASLVLIHYEIHGRNVIMPAAYAVTLSLCRNPVKPQSINHRTPVDSSCDHALTQLVTDMKSTHTPQTQSPADFIRLVPHSK